MTWSSASFMLFLNWSSGASVALSTGSSVSPSTSRCAVCEASIAAVAADDKSPEQIEVNIYSLRPQLSVVGATVERPPNICRSLLAGIATAPCAYACLSHRCLPPPLAPKNKKKIPSLIPDLAGSQPFLVQIHTVAVAPALDPVPSAKILLHRPPWSPLRRDLHPLGHGSQERGLVLRATPRRSFGGARRPPPPAKRRATRAAQHCEGAPAEHSVRLFWPGARGPPRDTAKARPTAEDPSTTSAPTYSSILYVLPSVSACKIASIWEPFWEQQFVLDFCPPQKMKPVDAYE
jgi:hypothetical protein